MAQDRLERLMNVIAYLSNAMRPLTLREIIDTVPGYPDSLDAARRAFERDKEKLRSLNFNIQVENTSDGQSGYVLRKEDTFYNIDLTARQRNIVEYALGMYGPEQQTAENTVTKLGGMNPENTFSQIVSLPMPDLIDDLFAIISQKQSIEILFKGHKRRVRPIRLIARLGYWYLLADDLDKQSPRTFRVDRIDEIIQTIQSDNSQKCQGDIPEIEDESLEVSLRVHPKLISLVCDAYKGHYDKPNDIVKIQISSTDIFISYLLEYSGFVCIIEPDELRQSILQMFDDAIESIKGK